MWRRSVAPPWCFLMAALWRRSEGFVSKDTLKNISLFQAQFKLTSNFLLTGGHDCVRHRLQLRFSLPAEQCHVQDGAPRGSVQACFSSQPGASHSGCCGFHPCPWSHHAPSWDAGPLGHTCLQRWGCLSPASCLDAAQPHPSIYLCLYSVFCYSGHKKLPSNRAMIKAIENDTKDIENK